VKLFRSGTYVETENLNRKKFRIWPFGLNPALSLKEPFPVQIPLGLLRLEAEALTVQKEVGRIISEMAWDIQDHPTLVRYRKPKYFHNQGRIASELFRIVRILETGKLPT
jgi:hypothetical protein